MAARLLQNRATSWLQKICGSRQVNLNRLGFHTTNTLDKTVLCNLGNVGAGISDVTVKQWFVKVGDMVEKFDALCLLQSQKASLIIGSHYDGIISKIYCDTSEIALVGKPLLDLELLDEGEDEFETTQKPLYVTAELNTKATKNKMDFAKLVSKAKNDGIVEDNIGGRLEHMQYYTFTAKSEAAPASSTNTAPADRVEKLKGARKDMLKSMSPEMCQLTFTDEIDMTNIVQLHKQEKISGEPELEVMPFCIKAASIALSKFPIVNSWLDLNNESIIYKGAHNISVAIHTMEGLVLANVKNCQNKTVMEINNEIEAMAERGLFAALEPTELADSTFSFFNIGTLADPYPKLMPPQVAVGALAHPLAVPGYNGKGKIVKTCVMGISWTVDQRVVDAVTMAQFSNQWKQYLENPKLFLMNHFDIRFCQ